ncbi:MAG: class I SAM-dependent rRNA methyltransferase [Verrucomicrobiota bacterium]
MLLWGAMSERLTIQLSRNLRRDILRGHPWIYRNAIRNPPPSKAGRLCRVIDMKGSPVAWALYDPHSPLALRVLSLDRQPPTPETYARRIRHASSLRRTCLPPDTTAWRLINGEGDLLPGMICDIYDRVAVLQFDGQGPREFWDLDATASWVLEQTDCDIVIEKRRGGQGIQPVAGEPPTGRVEVHENGHGFKVDLTHGQKTGLFLDQRDNRSYLGRLAEGKSLLNLFSYTGGFSVYAGRGGAGKVTSVDMAAGAIELSEANWALNGLPADRHHGVCDDVFDFLGSATDTWDIVVVDPPSMAHAEKQKPKAIAAYTALFADAGAVVHPGGHLILSSCSSHVTFDDFFDIINQALSRIRRKGRILHVSGQGPDHPFPHACHELRYLKFVHLLLD